MAWGTAQSEWAVEEAACWASSLVQMVAGMLTAAARPMLAGKENLTQVVVVEGLSSLVQVKAVKQGAPVPARQVLVGAVALAQAAARGVEETLAWVLVEGAA